MIPSEYQETVGDSCRFFSLLFLLRGAELLLFFLLALELWFCFILVPIAEHLKLHDTCQLFEGGSILPKEEVAYDKAAHEARAPSDERLMWVLVGKF